MRMTGLGALRSFSYWSLTEVGRSLTAAPMVAGGGPRGAVLALCCSRGLLAPAGSPRCGSRCFYVLLARGVESASSCLR